MKTVLEIIKEVNDIEKDLEIMQPTPGKVAWQYYVKALRWVLGDDIKLIGHFEIADKKSDSEAEKPKSAR